MKTEINKIYLFARVSGLLVFVCLITTILSLATFGICRFYQAYIDLQKPDQSPTAPARSELCRSLWTNEPNSVNLNNWRIEYLKAKAEAEAKYAALIATNGDISIPNGNVNWVTNANTFFQQGWTTMMLEDTNVYISGIEAEFTMNSQDDSLYLTLDDQPTTLVFSNGSYHIQKETK